MDQNAGNLDLGGGGKEGNLENLAVAGASSEGNASTSRKTEGLISQDGEGHILKAIGEPLSQFGPRSNDNSSNWVDKNDSENVMANNSAGNLSSYGKEVDFGTKSNEFRLAEASVEVVKEGVVVGEKMLCGQVEESTSGSLNNNHVNLSAAETAIVMNPEESVSLGRENRMGKGKVPGSDKAPAEKLVEAGEAGVINMKALSSSRGGLKESWDGEKVCRICHLTSEQSHESADGNSAAAGSATEDLIQLGCGCKDELGIAHRHCAEAWFKLKGNRMCEICGEMAKNITGVGDLRFIEGWNEQGFSGSNGSSSGRAEACWRGQPFCNFLMACLVISFVLPWFFRVNMF